MIYHNLLDDQFVTTEQALCLPIAVALNHFIHETGRPCDTSSLFLPHKCELPVFASLTVMGRESGSVFEWAS